MTMPDVAGRGGGGAGRPDPAGTELEALRAQVAGVDRLHARVDRMEAEMTRLAARLDAEAETFGRLARDLVTLDRKMDDGAEATTTLRRRLVALAHDVEWHADSNRKAIEAMLGLPDRAPARRGED